ncbi:unnamed protein product, partial [marine sediment metagenome]
KEQIKVLAALRNREQARELFKKARGVIRSYRNKV